MKFSKRSYGKATPKNLMNLGNSLMGVAGTITGAAIFAGNDTVAYIALGILVVGKFLTDFFEE